MRGVTFNNKHSYWDWHLLLKRRPVISPPVPKTKYVDIPGADGGLDLSRVLTGHIHYKQRKITFEFLLIAGRDAWPAIYTEILDTLHGKEAEIVFDDDPQYVYTGRVTVNKMETEKVTAVITMTADVEPYKTSKSSNPAYKNLSVDGSRTVMLHGMRKPTVPAFTASADMQVTFGGHTYDLPAGDSIIPDIVVYEGDNTFVFTGNGTVSIDYKGGRL